MTLGQQVPSGTIELYENPEAGARREAFEESGLDDFLEVRFLTTDVRSYAATVTDTDEVTERFFFQFKVQKGVSDAWEHTVSDGELDKGMVFSYRWLPIAAAQSILSHMGDYLQLLE